MYEDFHYFFKPIFNSPSIVMSDTDSFLFYCQGIDNIEEIIHTHADRFDLSNLGDHWLRDDRNCKVRKKKRQKNITI